MSGNPAKEFIFRVGKIGKRWGLGEPAGRIWGLLVYTRKPLSQREISEHCSYSLGLVSTSLRRLKRLNIVSDASRRGKERLYRAAASFSQTFSILVHKFRREELSHLLRLMKARMRSRAARMTEKEFRKINVMLSSLTRSAKSRPITSAEWR